MKKPPCVLQVFSRDVIHYMVQEDLSQQTVGQLALAMNSMPRDTLQALSLEVVGDDSPIKMLDQIIAAMASAK